MLVGEVRWATTGSGSSWKLSGGSAWSSARDEGLEEAPGAAGDQAQRRRVVASDELLGRRLARRQADPAGDDAATAATARRTAPAIQAAVGLTASDEDRDGQPASDDAAGHPPVERREVEVVAGLRLRGGHPFEQVPRA